MDVVVLSKHHGIITGGRISASRGFILGFAEFRHGIRLYSLDMIVCIIPAEGAAS